MRIPQFLSCVNTKSFHVVVAFILALSWWRSYDAWATVQRTYEVPCCFYDYGARTIAEAPEKIYIKLHGKRKEFRDLDLASLAVHIDVQQLSMGPQRLEITSDNLFLPRAIQVVSWYPSNASIVVQ